MNQFEMPLVIGQDFPQVQCQLRHLAVLGNAYASMKVLSDFTREMIVAHRYRQVQKCMQTAEKIYDRGDAVVRTAVENIFIYSFGIMRASCNKVQWRLVQSVIPSALFVIYMRQQNAIAC